MNCLLLPTQPRGVFGPARRAQPQQRIVLVHSQGAEGSSAPEPPTAAQEAPKDVCTTCGIPLSNKPWGCDGQGRIIGGLGSVPGFGWWPIKAYRECPEAMKKGIQYRRKGQITDEVLFGRGPQ